MTATAGVEPKPSDRICIGRSVDIHERAPFRRFELPVNTVLIAAQTQADGPPELFLALMPGPTPGEITWLPIST